MEQYGYIYIITNKLNGRKYIGQHKFSNGIDEDYWGSGKILIQAIEKYGIENFKRDIIQYAYSKKQLDELEKYYIKVNNAVFSDEYYNITTGGVGGTRYGKYNNWCTEDKTGENNPFYGHKHSEETKKRISESKKGQRAWNKGKKLTLKEKDILKKREFHLICKKCGQQFIAKTGNIKYCNDCKNK